MWVAILVALLVVILAFLYQRWTRRYGTLEKLGIPVKAPFLCFGSGPWALHKYVMFEKDGELFPQAEGTSSPPLTVGFYEGSQPVVFTMDPELIKEVFVKQSDHFQERIYLPMREEYKTLDVLGGEQWAFVRKSLTPVFTSGKIKSMVTPIEDCMGKALLHLDDKARASDGRVQIDVKNFMESIALEVILKVAFGVEGNLIGKDTLESESPIYQNARMLVDTDSSTGYLHDAFFVLFELEPDLGTTFMSWWMEKAMKYLNGLTRNVVKKRVDEGAEDSGDFIDRIRHVLKTVEESGGRHHGVPSETVVSQGALFLIAGFATTSLTMTNLIHFLSENPEAQERCYREICDNAESPEGINYETIGNMKYVEACIKEALRLRPPVTRNQRLCTKDVNVNGLDIKKGVRVDVPPYLLMRQKAFYGEDANVFDPERFLSGGKSASDSTFHAFGLGSRQCLGMRFAYVEMKMIIANLLSKFKILDSPEPKYARGSAFFMAVTKSEATLQSRSA